MVCADLAVAAEPSRVGPIFARLAAGNSPGVAVLVRKDDKTMVQRGYGVRDLRTLAPIDARTDFRLASFSKQFTAMAAMLLVHDGKLRYDDRLTQIFPDFPEYGRAITVRHLLTHTSGLPDYEELMGGGPWTETRQIQDDEVLALLKQQPTPKFAAGTSWAYSNSGYVVLGLIVAKVSAVRFGDFLRQRIFQPLHMDRTLVYVKGSNSVPNRAFGHTKRPEGFVETDQSSTSATLGDGGIYSNLEDLAKWDQALGNHTVLGEAEMEPALTAVRLGDGSETLWPAAPSGDNLNPVRLRLVSRPLRPPRTHVALGRHTRVQHGYRAVHDREADDCSVVQSRRSGREPTRASGGGSVAVAVFDSASPICRRWRTVLLSEPFFRVSGHCPR